jgi:mono/diheme cytochrome c family protein
MPDIGHLSHYANLNKSIIYVMAFFLLSCIRNMTHKKEVSMCKTLQIIAVCLLGIGLLCISLSEEAHAKAMVKRPLIAHGRYISQIGGCNDCHTSGYLLSDGKVPGKMWLAGSAFGWRGPWGTTYAANLRLFLQTMTENQWIAFAKAFKAKPPMPWFDVHVMEDHDLEALYYFIRYLGPGGKPAPAFVPPNKEPKTPYALFPSPPK